MLLKKYISLFIGLSMLVSGAIPIQAADKTEQNTVSLYEVLPHEDSDEIKWLESADFENKNNKVLGIDVRSNVVKTGSEHGNAFEVSSDGVNFFELPEVIERGITVIDFDLYNIRGGLAYLRLCNKDAANMSDIANFGESLVFAGESIGWYPNTAGWTMNMVTGLPYNTWHNVTMWLDMDYHMIYYSMDNKYLGSTSFSESKFKTLKKLWFVIERGANYRLDNLNVCTIERTLFESIREKGVTVPEDLFINYNVNANIGERGNAVYQKNVAIPAQIEITNKLIIDQDITVEFNVRDDETNNILWSREEKLTVHPGKNELKISLPGMQKYGYSNLETNIYDSEKKKLEYSNRIPYALVNLPDEGDYNKRMGICIHARFVGAHNDAPINLEMAGRAGFYSTRGEHDWSSYETEPGVYKLHSLMEEYIKRTAELKMGHYHILAYKNWLYAEGDPYVPILSDKSHNAFGNYSVNIIKDLMDRLEGGLLEVELYNEWNNVGSWFNDRGATPEDYAHFASIVYPMIKAKYPDVFVWGCSTVGIDNNWIERVLAAGGGEFMDGITVHPYSFTASPEAGGQKAGIEQLKNILKKYGYEDMPLCASEWGWASVGLGGYPDEMGQASYFVRFSAMDLTYDWFKSTYWYEMNDEGLVNTQEERFGLVRDDLADIPFGLKPSYLAAAMWNKTMNEAQAKGDVQLTDSATGYRFKLRNGKDCLIAWSPNDVNEFSAVDLGCDSVTLMDMYGNEQTIYADDGKINIYLDSNPVYIIGDFKKCEPSQASINASNDTVNALYKDDFSYGISKNTKKNYTFKVYDSNDIALSEQKSFGDAYNFIFTQNGENRETKALLIEIYDGDKLIGYFKPKVKYISVASMNMYIRPQSLSNTDWWQVYIDVKNNSMKDDLTGNLKVISPEVFSKSAGNTQIRTISPLSSGRIKLNIPKSLINPGAIMKINLEAEFSNGETVELEGNTSFELCSYAENKPVIDGVIDKNEYKEDVSVDLSKGRYVYLTGNAYEGEKDLSGKFYTAWDEENYYFAAEIVDEENSYDIINGGILWRSDGIQFAMAKYAGSSEFVQLDMACVNGENLLEIDRSSTGAQIGILPKDKYELQIKRNGDITTYELKLPWSTIYPKGVTIEKNNEFAFTMLVNDNDKGLREGYLEYGSGMGSGTSNTAAYKTFFMHGKSLIEDLK